MFGAIISAVMTAYSLKSVIDGLKDGDIGKAVMGGVGAYYGLTAGAGATTVTQEGVAKGAEGVAQAAADIGTEGAAGVIAEGAAPAQQAQANQIFGDTADKGAAITDMASVDKVKGQGLLDRTTKKPGLLSRGVEWIKKNPEVSKMLGQGLQGWQQEALLHDKWSRDERLMREERQRRGASAGSQQNYAYDPSTRRMVKVGG